MKAKRVSRWELGLLDYLELIPLGLDPDFATGLFYKPDKLLDFVSRNPNYHIVSLVPVGEIFHYINRFEPKGASFMLSDGDPNPWHYAAPMEFTAETLEQARKDLTEAGGGTLSEDSRLFLAFMSKVVEEW